MDTDCLSAIDTFELDMKENVKEVIALLEGTSHQSGRLFGIEVIKNIQSVTVCVLYYKKLYEDDSYFNRFKDNLFSIDITFLPPFDERNAVTILYSILDKAMSYFCKDSQVSDNKVRLNEEYYRLENLKGSWSPACNPKIINTYSLKHYRDISDMYVKLGKRYYTYCSNKTLGREVCYSKVMEEGPTYYVSLTIRFNVCYLKGTHCTNMMRLKMSQHIARRRDKSLKSLKQIKQG